MSLLILFTGTGTAPPPAVVRPWYTQLSTSWFSKLSSSFKTDNDTGWYTKNATQWQEEQT